MNEAPEFRPRRHEALGGSDEWRCRSAGNRGAISTHEPMAHLAAERIDRHLANPCHFRAVAVMRYENWGRTRPRAGPLGPQPSWAKRRPMTPEERIALIRRTTDELWNKGNLAVCDEVYASHCSFHDPSFTVDGWLA
jgi:hypothetical protein